MVPCVTYAEDLEKGDILCPHTCSLGLPTNRHLLSPPMNQTLGDQGVTLEDAGA